MVDEKTELRASSEQIRGRTVGWNSMPRAAEAASKHLRDVVSELCSVDNPVRIVATAEDLTFVRGSWGRSASGPTIHASWTCLWLRLTATPFETYPLAVETVRRYREPVDENPSAVVVFVPYIRERSIARTVMLFAVSDHPGIPVHLVALAAVSDQVDELRSEVVGMTGTEPKLHVLESLTAVPPTWTGDYPDEVAPPNVGADGVPRILAGRMLRTLRRLHALDGPLAEYVRSRDNPHPAP